jgi:hypothetical protein
MQLVVYTPCTPWCLRDKRCANFIKGAAVISNNAPNSYVNGVFLPSRLGDVDQRSALAGSFLVVVGPDPYRYKPTRPTAPLFSMPHEVNCS